LSASSSPGKRKTAIVIGGRLTPRRRSRACSTSSAAPGRSSKLLQCAQPHDAACLVPHTWLCPPRALVIVTRSPSMSRVPVIGTSTLGDSTLVSPRSRAYITAGSWCSVATEGVHRRSHSTAWPSPDTAPAA
jgi:hypothetical protein